MDELLGVDDLTARLRADEIATMRTNWAALAAHCGADLSEVQRGLIDRAVWLRLYLTRLDSLALKAGQVYAGKGAQQYLSYSNALTRNLAQLGLQPAAKPAPTLADILARPLAQGAAA